MEYTLDELLDITAEYLDKVDFTGYFEKDAETNMEDVQTKLLDDFNQGNLPELPEALDNNIFKVFDLWDLTVYLRNRYNMFLREELYYIYYLSDLTDKK